MRHGLILVSVVFFWFPVLIALTQIFPSSGSLLWAMILVPAGIISFAGATLLLHRTVSVSARRSLVYPLFLDLSTVIAGGLYGLFIMKAFPSGLTGEIWATTLLLLAPCSVAIFISIPGESLVRSASIYLAVFISAYSILTIIFLIYGHFEPMLGLTGYYWFAGMPVIGICYLACAAFIGENPQDHDEKEMTTKVP